MKFCCVFLSIDSCILLMYFYVLEYRTLLFCLSCVSVSDQFCNISAISLSLSGIYCFFYPVATLRLQYTVNGLMICVVKASKKT